MSKPLRAIRLELDVWFSSAIMERAVYSILKTLADSFDKMEGVRYSTNSIEKYEVGTRKYNTKKAREENAQL